MTILFFDTQEIFFLIFFLKFPFFYWKQFTMSLYLLIKSNLKSYFTCFFVIGWIFSFSSCYFIWFMLLNENMLIVKYHKLPNKIGIWFCTISFVSDIIDCFLKIPWILAHQICTNYGCWSWYTCMTMNQYVMPFKTTFMNKLSRLFEIL